MGREVKMSGACVVCFSLLDRKTSCFWAPENFKDLIRVVRTTTRDKDGKRTKGFNFTIRYEDNLTRGPFCTSECLDVYRSREDDLLALVLGAEEEIYTMRVWDYVDIVAVIDQIGKDAMDVQYPGSMEPRETWKSSESIRTGSGFGGNTWKKIKDTHLRTP